MIRAVSATQLPIAWPHIEPHLKRFEAQGEASAERLRYLVEQREAQLWTHGDREVHGVLITQVQESTKGRRLLIWVAVGDGRGRLRELICESLEVLKAFGREVGCKRVRIVGRKGWSKVMPDFREVGRVLECEL